MNTKWKLGEKELSTVLHIFNKGEIPGIFLALPEESEMIKVCDAFFEKEILIKTATGTRIEEGLLLTLLTMIDRQSCLLGTVKNSHYEKICNIYMHGNSMIVLEKENDCNFFEICWIPHYKLAIGAITEMYHKLDDKIKDEDCGINVSAQYSKDISHTKQWERENGKYFEKEKDKIVKEVDQEAIVQYTMNQLYKVCNHIAGVNCL